MTIRSDIESAAKLLEAAYSAANSNAELAQQAAELFDDEKAPVYQAIENNARIITDRIQDARNDLERAFGKAYAAMNQAARQLANARSKAPQPRVDTRGGYSKPAMPRSPLTSRKAVGELIDGRGGVTYQIIAQGYDDAQALANDERAFVWEDSPDSGLRIARIESVEETPDETRIDFMDGGYARFFIDGQGYRVLAVRPKGEAAIEPYFVAIAEEMDDEAAFLAEPPRAPGPSSPSPDNPPKPGRDVELRIFRGTGPGSIIGKVQSVTKTAKTIKIRTQGGDLWPMRWTTWEGGGRYEGADPFNKDRRYMVRFYPPR